MVSQGQSTMLAVIVLLYAFSHQMLTAALVSQTVTLSSTLSEDHIAYSQQYVIFTCVTRGSDILEWRSEEYIGIGEDALQLLAIDDIGTNVSSANKMTVANLVNVSHENGVPVIVSRLTLRASLLYPVSTISCSNNGHGSSKNIMFLTQENVNGTKTTLNDQPTSTTTELEKTTDSGKEVNDIDSLRPWMIGVIITAVIIIIIATIFAGVILGLLATNSILCCRASQNETELEFSKPMNMMCMKVLYAKSTAGHG